MNLKKTAKILHTKLTGNNAEFLNISIDTRTLQAGDLFIAIEGEKFDGHDFIQAAEEKQAAAAVISKPIETHLPTLLVEDTTQALGKLASFHRDKFDIPIIGITGSCGKTTTRSLIANILQQENKTLSSQKSFNNQIGVPLTLLGLNKQHHYAVIEMGTNHFGEISYLTHIAKPTITLITNAAPVHLEGLKSVEGVSRAKGEIFEGLPSDGIGIINIDDEFSPYWSQLVSPKKIMTFSIQKKADVYAKNIQCNNQDTTTFTLVTPQGKSDIELPLLGKHNVANATAAACIACALSIPLSSIQKGISTITPVDHRLNTYTGHRGAHIINDSYNANPLAFKAALGILADQPGKKILVSGDMKELGKDTKTYHEELGIEAKKQGIQSIYAYGEFSKYTADAFGENAQHFLDQEQLIDTLKPALDPQTTVLIKGSLSMNMGHIAEALKI